MANEVFILITEYDNIQVEAFGTHKAAYKAMTKAVKHIFYGDAKDAVIKMGYLPISFTGLNNTVKRNHPVYGEGFTLIKWDIQKNSAFIQVHDDVEDNSYLCASFKIVKRKVKQEAK